MQGQGRVAQTHSSSCKQCLFLNLHTLHTLVAIPPEINRLAMQQQAAGTVSARISFANVILLLSDQRRQRQLAEGTSVLV